MHDFRLNKAVMQFEESHIARRFLHAFVQCKRDCVGKEITYRDSSIQGIDQEWQSAVDGRKWTFSAFTYCYISFTMELDGWNQQPLFITSSERTILDALPNLRALLKECREACEKARNRAVLAMVEQVEALFRLWEECVMTRIASLPKNKVSGTVSI